MGVLKIYGGKIKLTEQKVDFTYLKYEVNPDGNRNYLDRQRQQNRIERISHFIINKCALIF